MCIYVEDAYDGDDPDKEFALLIEMCFVKLKERTKLSLGAIRSVIEEHDAIFGGMFKRIYGELNGEEVDQALQDWRSKIAFQKNDEHSQMPNALDTLKRLATERNRFIIISKSRCFSNILLTLSRAAAVATQTTLTT